MVIGLASALALTACAANEAPSAQTPVASEEFAGAGVIVTAPEKPEGQALKSKLEQQLVRTGHRVATTESEAHELTAVLSVTLSESKGLLTVYVDGKPKQSFTAQASLHVRGGSQLLAVEEIEYDAEDGPSEEQVQQLASALAGPPVRRYLSALKKKRRDAVDAERREQEEVAAREAADAAEKRKAEEASERAAWSELVLAECTSPTQVNGCASVKRFLARYPSGEHAAEAKAALETGSPLVPKLADETAWSEARVSDCKVPKSTDGCDGVLAYLAAQPAGAHAEEARTMLDAAEPKLEQLRKNQEREQEAELARFDEEEKRAKRAECAKACSETCFGLAPSRYNACKSQCQQARCD